MEIPVYVCSVKKLLPIFTRWPKNLYCWITFMLMRKLVQTDITGAWVVMLLTTWKRPGRLVMETGEGLMMPKETVPLQITKEDLFGIIVFGQGSVIEPMASLPMIINPISLY